VVRSYGYLSPLAHLANWISMTAHFFALGNGERCNYVRPSSLFDSRYSRLHLQRTAPSPYINNIDIRKQLSVLMCTDTQYLSASPLFHSELCLSTHSPRPPIPYAMLCPAQHYVQGAGSQGLRSRSSERYCKRSPHDR